jgi:hypothetical protein
MIQKSIAIKTITNVNGIMSLFPTQTSFRYPSPPAVGSGWITAMKA